MATLKVEIVTPEAALWVGEASALVARSREGWFTILPEHTETVGDIVSSVVRVDTAEGALSFAVHGGFFQVGREGEDVTLATILAGIAEKTTEIDVARAQRARDSAEQEIAAQSRGDAHDASASLMAQAAITRAELRLSAATT